jgi:hypothetical protein
VRAAAIAAFAAVPHVLEVFSPGFSAGGAQGAQLRSEYAMQPCLPVLTRQTEKMEAAPEEPLPRTPPRAVSNQCRFPRDIVAPWV